MSIFTDFIGTMSSFFQIGGTSGGRIKNNSSGLEAKDSSDSNFIAFRAKFLASGGTLNDLATMLDLKGRCPNVEYDFAGGSPPDAGDNTNKFGFCHTTGGIYTAGDVIYDTGSLLIVCPFATTITTKTAITGTISMIANGLYAIDAGTWTLKGDGGAASTGFVKFVEVPFTYNSGTSGVNESTVSIPDGARIVGADTIVTTAFDGTAPTASINIQGSSPVTVQSTTGNNLKVVNQYKSQAIIQIGSTGAGLVRVTVVPDGSAAGVGIAYVWYVTAPNV